MRFIFKPHFNINNVFLLIITDRTEKCYLYEPDETRVGLPLISGTFRNEFARCIRHNVKELVQLLKDILNKTDAQRLENMADDLNIAKKFVDILQANPRLAQPVYNILIAVDNTNAAALLASAVENLSLN